MATEKAPRRMTVDHARAGNCIQLSETLSASFGAGSLLSVSQQRPGRLRQRRRLVVD
jgi:hypothetical protein